MKRYDKEIDEALEKMVEAGAEFEKLVIVTSREEFKEIPMHQITFRSVYGDTKVNYDPLLPQNALYIISQSEVKTE